MVVMMAMPLQLLQILLQLRLLRGRKYRGDLRLRLCLRNCTRLQLFERLIDAVLLRSGEVQIGKRRRFICGI